MSIGRWFAPLPVDEGVWWGPLCYAQHGEDSDSRKPNVDSSGSSPMNPFCTEPDYVQNFITQTYKMVDDPSTDPLLLWSSQGDSFFVRSTIQLATVVLPRYFNHSCISKFFLELSAYGFRFRLADCDLVEFAKEEFIRGPRHPLQKGFGFSLGREQTKYAKEGFFRGQTHPIQMVHNPIPIMNDPSLRQSTVTEELVAEGVTSQAFVAQTRRMLDDPVTDHIVSWVPTGHSFVVRNLLDMARHVLPKYLQLDDFYDFVFLICLNGFRFRSTAGNSHFEFAREGFVRGYVPFALWGQKTAVQSTQQGSSSEDVEFEEKMKEDTVEIQQEMKELEERIKELTRQCLTLPRPEGWYRVRPILEIKNAMVELKARMKQMSRQSGLHVSALDELKMDIKEDILEIEKEMVKLKEGMDHIIQAKETKMGPCVPEP